jgi:hypothetical protein
MKDHSKIFREIQERAFKEAEEKKRLREQERLENIEKEEPKDNTEKGKEIEIENKIEKEIEIETASSLHNFEMANPTPQDFYNLQEQFTQMQAMMPQLRNSNQSLTQAPQSNFDVVKLFLKSTTTFHYKHNPQKVKLLYNGSNYQQWEREINRSLSYFFETETRFVDNKANFVTRGNTGPLLYP